MKDLTGLGRMSFLGRLMESLLRLGWRKYLPRDNTDFISILPKVALGSAALKSLSYLVGVEVQLNCLSLVNLR